MTTASTEPKFKVGDKFALNSNHDPVGVISRVVDATRRWEYKVLWSDYPNNDGFTHGEIYLSSLVQLPSFTTQTEILDDYSID